LANKRKTHTERCKKYDTRGGNKQQKGKKNRYVGKKFLIKGPIGVLPILFNRRITFC
jgi:hypothetical protein